MVPSPMRRIAVAFLILLLLSLGILWWRTTRPSTAAWEEEWRKPAEISRQAAETGPARPAVPRDTPAAPADFSPQPVDSEIATSRAFPNALLPADTASTTDPAAQNRILADFLQRYRTTPDAEVARKLLSDFLEGKVPERWRPALELEAAAQLYQRGFFDDCRELAQAVWTQLRERRDVNSALLADRAASQLLDLELGRGNAAALRELVAQNEGRPYHGSLEGKLLRARQSVWLLAHTGAQNIACGPRALNAVMDYQGRDYQPIRLDKATADYIATGLPLTEVESIAGRMGWQAQMVRRIDPASPVPVPAVFHIKEGHYAALLERDPASGDYFMEDRGMGFAGWISPAALDRMSSGNFVVAAGGMPGGFAKLDVREGQGIFGRDGAHAVEDTGVSNDDPPTTGGDGCPGPGMVSYTLLPQMAAVRLSDTPLGYDPPVGPPVEFSLGYDELDTGSPATPAHSNAGRLWRVNWITWVDPPSGNLANGSILRARLSSGGTREMIYKSATGVFGPHDRHFSTARKLSTTSYEMLYPDGSRELYAAPNNATTPTRIYLSQRFDPQGNSLSFTYDAQLRLTAVTDTIGQVTELFYEHATDPLKITRVRDPFGREATLAYNAGGQLTGITDVIGLTSTLEYTIGGDLIQKFTTPYGVTSFAKTVSGWNRTVEVTDPKGDKERVQFADPGTAVPGINPPPANFFVDGQKVSFFAENDRLQFRNSYYWGKVAMAVAPGDVSAARNYRWYTSAISFTVIPVLEAVKEPLEDRVWFNYPGTSGAQKTASSYPNYPAKGAHPEHIVRVLADGTPQVVQMAYNENGLPTKSVDPVGRKTEYSYAANGLDLTEVRQTTGGTNQRLTAIAYNAQHLPTSVTDAAGQITTFTYTPRGQVLTVTNAKSEVTAFTYDPNGYLTTIDGPLAGTGDSTTFTYDSVGRPRTVTAPDGYALTYDYDNFDRVKKITYPDTTYEEYTYNRLDRTAYRDRLGRITTFEYNGLRQLVKTTDPANRSVAFDWCKCGDLRTLTDPLGRVTRWVHDIQGRVTAKVYADGSKLSYLYEPQTSRLAQRIDEKGQSTLYTYNVDDTLKSVSYPDAQVATPTVSYAYDSVFNRVTSMTDGIGVTTYSYHPITGSPVSGAGQLASVDGPWANDTVTYAYDVLGRTLTRSINGVGETNAFDAAGRVSSVNNPLGTFIYEYAPNTARLSSIFHSGGMKTEFSYFGNNEDNRLSRIRHLKPGGTVSISTFDYTYDAEGRITTWAQQEDTTTAKTWELSYDNADQLAAAIVKQGPTTLRSSAWEYDPAGNRTKEIIDGTATTSTYNSLNELTHVSATATSATYEWDAENRLTAVVLGNARSEFVYDGLSRRVKIVEKTNGVVDSATTYLWCDLEICERRDESGGNVQQRYYGQGFQGVSGGPMGVHLYTMDHLGSVRELVDSSGSLKERISYDEWGRPTFSNQHPLTTFAFTGHLQHGRSGLTLAPYRAYSSSQGRWLSRDPLEEADSFNLFSYVRGYPTGAIDPLGLMTGRDMLGFVPVVGSAMDSYDAFRCGNIGMGLLHLGLAAMDLTGAGAIVKGLTVGTMKYSARKAIKAAYKNSTNWDDMRRALQKSGAVVKNSRATPNRDWMTTDHIFFKQRSKLPHWILNHPANLQTNVPQSLNSAFEGMNAFQRAMHLPAWMKTGAAGVGSSAAGGATGSGCGCN